VTDPKKTLRYPEVMAEEGLDDWRFFLKRLHARFRTGSFVRGLELVTRITEVAEAANHHPDVVLTYPQVDVDLTSHDVGGVTSRDLELARQISVIAAELEIEAAPREVSRLELALDVPDAAEVRNFWATVLGYDQNDSEPEVWDNGGRNNTLWFQQAPDATGEVQQRFHLDIVVPRDIAEERVQAAIDAGGILVSTEDVPALMERVTRFTRWVNYLGLPAVSVPCGFTASELPVAYQLLGRPFAEARLLRIAHTYQQGTDWHRRVPALQATERAHA